MKKWIPILLTVTLLAAGLAACGSGKAPEAQPTAEPAVTPTEAPEDPAEAIEQVPVLEEGMTPVTAESLADGVYPVEIKTSTPLFQADHAELSAEGGKLQAVLYVKSDSYGGLYPGSAEAAAADPDGCIHSEKTDDGFNRFVLPIDALDQEIKCAVFSSRKQVWYDRAMLLRADSLPYEAYAEGVIPTAESLGLADGEYTVEVILEGGSGRATVTSPAKLTVEDGAASAEIIWSSSNYDYMRIGEEKYLPVTTEGGSTFILPVEAFDLKLRVAADTTAMSKAHEIDYTLFFRSDSLQSAK